MEDRYTPNVYSPKPGDIFEHATRGQFVFWDAPNGQQYRMQSSKGHLMPIWRTEFQKYYKPVSRLKTVNAEAI